ncbi:MAG TPA: PilZ domain-containing protein, partial [Acidimicrobiia bacterium]|nr:PilZ domain-containing protein [Acidimicrobiia bacterium]
ATAADEPSTRMIVDLVQDGHITLATPGDESLPKDWGTLEKVHLTCLGRFSVYLIHVPVVRSGATRLVISAPDDDTAIQRRAYARVLHHVPVSCTVLDASTNTWTAFGAEVRDLGGGGCSVLTDLTPTAGSTVAMSFAIDEDGPFVALARVLPREALPRIGKPLTRVEFVLIRESDRDRIMRFVLLLLSQHRRAELGPE